MLLSDTLSTALRGITVNTSRTLLTTLGIIIGVGSVVLMISIGNSFQSYILLQIESIGTNTLDIAPVGLQKFGGNLQSLTIDDYEAVKRLSTVTNVVPVIVVGRPVHYGNETRNPMVFATTAQIFQSYGQKLADGRFLDQNDEDGAKSVAVISSQVAKDIFGDLDPIGKRITVGSASFTIVGLLSSQGSLLLSNLDNIVYIPFSVGRVLSGQTYLTYMTLKTVGDPSIAKEDITALLRQRHHIINPENDPDKDDFAARSAEQVTSIVDSVTLGLTIFLALIAAISLLVGGIGIMNIMLVSVTERTREIGLRKAVGATKRDILLQFLLEAVSLTFTGGAIGLLSGAAIGWLLASIASRFLGPFPFILSVTAIIVSIAMAVGTGLVFGLYPAKRAADLSPMEALRYE